MKNLRKFGSVAAAGALAATMSVAGVTAANAATLTPGGTMVNNYYLTGSETGVKAVDAEGSTATGFTDLRMAPVGGYTNVEYDETGITDYTLGAVPATESVVASFGKAAGLGDTVEEVLSNLKSAENWTAFIAAVKDVAGEEFGTTAGRALTLRDDNVYKPSHNQTDKQHIAGLHIVYSTSNAIEPFLIYTQVTDGNGTTVYPVGLSADNPYSLWKSTTVDEEEPTPDPEPSNPKEDVYLRVAGNDAADVSPFGQEIDFAHSTPLAGVKVTVERGDGTPFTGTTDENGWAKFEGAMEGRLNANYSVDFTITEISYAGDAQVEERLKLVEGSDLVIQRASMESGYTTFERVPEIKVSWNGVNVVPEGATAAAGTFTIIYSTVFDTEEPGTDLPVTGAAGIAVLVILGLVALGGGMALRRKKAQEQA